MARKAKSKPEAPSEVGKNDAQFWLDEISAAKSRLEHWYEAAENAEDRYRDTEARKFGMLNIFWANVETQKAAIGEEFGKPQVTRVNQPENDGGLSRHIANVWERCIAAAVREDNDNHDIGLAVGDQFIPGKGTVWLELEAKEASASASHAWACAPLVRVPYKHFLEGPATRWGSVPWVARLHLFTRDELESECDMSADEAAKVPLNIELPYEGKDKPAKRAGKEQFKRAAVWEIWTKAPEKARLYVAEDFADKVLLYSPDPYKLKHFFPCPRPILANGDEGWQEPLTDYSRYEDQAMELDEISARIYVLTAVLKRRGVHDKAFKEMADLASAGDNISLAVENWAELQNKGGLQKVMEWEDLVPVITVLVELHKQRAELIKLIYELSGISDLARGMTDANETLGAQKLKMSFGAGRFRSRETDARRFAAEAYALKGEVIAEHFPREQLEEMSGIKLPLQADIDKAKRLLAQMQQQYEVAQKAQIQLPPPNPQQLQYLQGLAATKFSWEAVSKVLRSDYRRCYTVEVETDQSNMVDEEADKKARTEFVAMVNQLLMQFGPMIAGNPANGEVLKQLIMFALGAFRAGRSMEEGIEQAIDNAIKQAAQQKQGPQQDPKAAAEAQAAQLKLQTAQVGLQKETIKLQQVQAEAQGGGADSQAKLQKAQLDVQAAQLKQQEAASKAQAGAVKVQQQAQQTQLKAVEGQQNVATKHAENQAKVTGHQIDMQNKAEQLQFERTERATAREEILKDNSVKERQRQTAAKPKPKPNPAAA